MKMKRGNTIMRNNTPIIVPENLWFNWLYIENYINILKNK
jgi:hypothetical protein